MPQHAPVTPGTPATPGTPLTIDQQLRRATEEFRKRFGRAPTHAAVAPGRVNLIGEHVDYNDGFVLPMAIQRQTVIVAAHSTSPNTSPAVVQLQSAQTTEPATFELDHSLKPGQPAWANYVKGVLAQLLRRRVAIPGFDALVDSTVDLGSGLSSSAALEVATATLIESITGKSLDPVDKALLCQKAEHEFPQVPCGIMDQFISALGKEGHALLLDCRSHQTRLVPMTDPSIAVLIANTNVKHALTGGEYAQRRSQCHAAAEALGVKSLRDTTLADLEAARARLDSLAYRRARHVITEIDRTGRAALAAQNADWATMGKLMDESHVSLRDDFEVSCPELDIMASAAWRIGAAGGVYGARMTGGGFGGCTVTLVKADAVDAVTASLRHVYKTATGIEPTIFASRPAAGARVLTV